MFVVVKPSKILQEDNIKENIILLSLSLHWGLSYPHLRYHSIVGSHHEVRS